VANLRPYLGLRLTIRVDRVLSSVGCIYALGCFRFSVVVVAVLWVVQPTSASRPANATHAIDFLMATLLSEMRNVTPSFFPVRLLIF
jgi:hypothetical protein